MTDTTTTSEAERSLAPELACSLNDLERGERITWFCQSLLPAATKRREIDDGVQILFAKSDAVRRQIETFISLERDCCGFADFAIVDDPVDQCILLNITGSVKAQGVIRQMVDVLLLQAI